MELLTQNYSLSSKLRVPAISRLQKLHNTEVALTSLESSGCSGVRQTYPPKDIVDGHREQTLGLLWTIIFKFQASWCLILDLEIIHTVTFHIQWFFVFDLKNCVFLTLNSCPDKFLIFVYLILWSDIWRWYSYIWSLCGCRIGMILLLAWYSMFCVYIYILAYKTCPSDKPTLLTTRHTH